MLKKNEEKEESILEKTITFNPLHVEYVTYQYVKKSINPLIDNANHIYNGGLSNKATISVCLPMVGLAYADIFSNNEREFLEKQLHLKEGSLSPYGDYWDSFRVDLSKDVLNLDLSKPLDYIRDKLLLANEDLIAPSLEVLNDPAYTKATYRFVRINTKDSGNIAKKKISIKSKAYIAFGKLQNDWDKMFYLAQHVSKKIISPDTSIEDLEGLMAELVELKPDTVLMYTDDVLFDTKVMLEKSLRKGVFKRVSDEIYTTDNTKLCETDKRATIENVAIFLNRPENQEQKFIIEAKLTDIKK